MKEVYMDTNFCIPQSGPVELIFFKLKRITERNATQNTICKLYSPEQGSHNNPLEETVTSMHTPLSQWFAVQHSCSKNRRLYKNNYFVPLKIHKCTDPITKAFSDKHSPAILAELHYHVPAQEKHAVVEWVVQKAVRYMLRGEAEAGKP